MNNLRQGAAVIRSFHSIQDQGSRGRLVRHRNSRHDFSSDVFDRLPHAGDFVREQVIHHDDVGWQERWRQLLLDVRRERLAVHRAVDH